MKRLLILAALIVATAQGQAQWVVSGDQATGQVTVKLNAGVTPTYIAPWLPALTATLRKGSTTGPVLAVVPLDPVTHACTWTMPNVMADGTLLRDRQKFSVFASVQAARPAYISGYVLFAGLAWLPDRLQSVYDTLNPWGRGWLCEGGDATGAHACDGALAEVPTAPIWTWTVPQKTISYVLNGVTYTYEAPALRLYGELLADSSGIYATGVAPVGAVRQGLAVLAPTGLTLKVFTALQCGSDAPGYDSGALAGTMVAALTDGKLHFDVTKYVGTADAKIDAWGPMKSDGRYMTWCNTTSVDGEPVGWGVGIAPTKWSIGITTGRTATAPEWAADGTSVVICLAPPWNKPAGLYCLNETTGATVWYLPAVTVVSPVIVGSKVLTQDMEQIGISPSRRVLTCRDLATGAVQWRRTGLNIVCAGNGVLVVSDAGIPTRLTALDIASGMPLWTLTLDKPFSHVIFARSSHTLLFDTGGLLKLYDARTGGLLSTGAVEPFEVGGVIGNRLYTRSGNTIRAYQSPSALYSDPPRPVPVRPDLMVPPPSPPALSTAPVFLSEPPSQVSYVAGQPITLSVCVNPLTAGVIYQWQQDGVAISDAASSSYAFLPDGTHILTCTATDAAGNSITSAACQVRPAYAPIIPPMPDVVKTPVNGVYPTFMVYPPPVANPTGRETYAFAFQLPLTTTWKPVPSTFTASMSPLGCFFQRYLAVYKYTKAQNGTLFRYTVTSPAGSSSVTFRLLTPDATSGP